MTPTSAATRVATPMFCSMTRIEISPSSPSSTSMRSTWSTMIGARPSVGSSMTRRRGLPSSAPADRQHLLLAAGELRAAVGLALGEPREGLVDAVDRPGGIAAAAGGELQVLVDRQAWPDPAALRHVADADAADLVRLEAGDLAAGNRDRAGARPLQPGDGVAERRLAHAVAADDRQHAGRQGEVNALNGVALAIIDVQVADAQDGALAALVAPAAVAPAVVALGPAVLSHARPRDRSPALRDRARSRRACLP